MKVEKLKNNINITPTIMHRNFDIKGLGDSILPNKTGFFAYIVGGVGSGKSTLMLSLLNNEYKQKFNNVYWFSPSSHTMTSLKIKEDHLKTSLSDLPKVVETVENQYKNGLKDGKVFSTLIVLDDMIADIKKKDTFMKKLVLNRAHSNISLCILSQKYKELPLIYRVNASHIVLFRTYNQKEIQAFIEETDLMKSRKIFNEAIDYAFGQDRGFLYADLQKRKMYSKFEEQIIEN
jgi:hypothetical protein